MPASCLGATGNIAWVTVPNIFAMIGLQDSPGFPAVRFGLARLPPFVLPQQAGRAGQRDLDVSMRVCRSVAARCRPGS